MSLETGYMMNMRFVCALWLVACGGPGLDSGGDYDPACDDGAPPDTYVAGLSRDTLNNVFTLAVTADPAPPDVGDVAFSFEVVEGSVPLTDGTLTIRPWMPLHGHGSVPETLDGVSDGAGVFAVPEIDLFMSGLWEIHVTVTRGETTDEGLYRFCLEG